MAQTHAQQRSFSERLNTWVQTAGILIAATWGVYTFVYKEIVLPKSAVNITLSLQLKKIETGASSDDLIPVQASITATNPSSREIFLLPSAWVASGGVVKPAVNDETAFTDSIRDTLNAQESLFSVQRHAKLLKSSFVAAGHLFDDTSLRPGETATRTLIFHVPKHDYDIIYFSAWMPNARDITDLRLEWILDKPEPRTNVYRLGKHGERIPLPMDKEGVPLDKELDFQMAEAQTEISLRP